MELSELRQVLPPDQPAFRAAQVYRAIYNQKVSDLVHSHPDLGPEVFTTSGGAPYLVSVGGVMDRDAAYALAHRSRSLGLPRDTFAQNYSH